MTCDVTCRLRVWGLGFRVQDLRLENQGLGFKFEGLGSRVSGLRLGIRV